jgi:FtsZ-binding cell division protein ZapB
MKNAKIIYEEVYNMNNEIQELKKLNNSYASKILDLQQEQSNSYREFERLRNNFWKRLKFLIFKRY